MRLARQMKTPTTFSSIIALCYASLLLAATAAAAAQQQSPAPAAAAPPGGGGGGVFTPAAPLTFSAWVGANESWFQYPEQQAAGNYSIPQLLAKPSLGIALSGGGFRAATTGLGFLRGLFLLNITGQARYLTSNSGGSWLNAAFSFQSRMPLDAFLGTRVPPEQLSLQQLQSPAAEGSFERTIADAGVLVAGALGALANTVEALVPGEDKLVGAWSAAVGRAFLAPYGLNSDASTFTAAAAGPVHQDALVALPPTVEVYRFSSGADTAVNSSNGGANATRAASARPFPVMLGSILLPETQLGFFPFEFSPLYVGCPAFFNNTQPPIGGGFVDPLGFKTQPPQPPLAIPAPISQAFAATSVTGYDAATGTLLTNVTLGNANATSALANSPSAAASNASGNSSDLLMRLLPLKVTAASSFVVPLKVVMGISSSFITNLFRPGGKITRELTGTETLQYWSPLASDTGKALAFGDGGSADNLAVTPLLRRRVSKLVVLVAASANISASTSPDDWAGYQWDIAGLFGACPATHPAYDADGTITGVPVPLFNRKLQVFPSAGWTELHAALKNSTAAGGPTHHLASYTVQTNPYQAVFGGWQVDVLWVVNQQQSAWEAALPTDTQQALASSRGQQQQQPGGILGAISSVVADTVSEATGQDGSVASSLKGFPFISTGKANYSPQLTRLLSQQGTWQLLQLRPQLERLLQPAR